MDPSHAAILAFEVNLVRIIGVDESNEPIATADSHPIRVHWSSSIFTTRRTTPTAVVLKAAVNFVVHRRVDSDVIELTDRNVIQVIPVLHAILRDVEPAVATKNHVAGVPFVDPQSVMVGVNSVRSAIAGERFAAVFGFIETCAANVDVVAVNWIDLDVAVVHRARIQRIDSLPR